VEHGRPAIRFDVTPRTLLLTVLAAIAVWLLIELWFVVVLVVISLVIAAALHPLVVGLEARRVPRILALALVFLGLAGALVAVCLLTVPALFGEIANIVERLPILQAELAGRMQDSRLLRPLSRALVTAPAAELGSAVLERMLAWGPRVLIIAGEALTVLFLALYILAGREREQAALFSVVPRRYHLRLARIQLNLRTIVGGYVRGQVITSACAAAFTFLLLTALGVKNAIALAVFAGLTNVIPLVGTILGAIPIVLASMARGLPTAILVLVLFLLYQELESRLLVPRVYGRVLRLSPVMVVVALLVGGTLLGIIGALLAIPVAAAVRMIIVELHVEMPGDDVDATALRRRDQAAEREFAARAAGAPAADAARIATTMADSQKAAEVPVTAGTDDSTQPA
jgi:predicted PurR-regulated permease PerM